MRTAWMVVCLALFACDDGSEGVRNEPDGMGALDGSVDAASPVAAPADGLWAVGLTLEEFGGLVLQAQLEVVITDAVFTVAKLRVVANGQVSEPVGDAMGAQVQPDGTFRLEFGEVVVPGAFSPTNSDVSIEVVLVATSREDDFCGDLRGNVVTFDTELEASTFGAAPWVGVATPGPGSCDPPEDVMFPRIETCPALATGLVEGFETGGVSRSFYLQVPTDYDAAELYPLIIAHHGLGGSPDGLNDQADMRSMVDDEGFLLVQPAGRDVASGWANSAAGDSEDLALFDDVVRCLSEQYSVDAARIHSVGHSAGGYYNSLLTIERAEVLASTGGLSPGLLIDYAPSENKPAMIVAWGGVDDIAFGQDFDVSSKKVMNTFAGNGHFVVGCDHSVLPLREDLSFDASRHTWPIDGARWFVRFLLDHPKGATPYEGGLPDDFPADICSIWVAE